MTKKLEAFLGIKQKPTPTPAPEPTPDPAVLVPIPSPTPDPLVLGEPDTVNEKSDTKEKNTKKRTRKK